MKRTDPKSKSDRPRNDKTSNAAPDSSSIASAESNESDANLPKRQTASWLKKMERIVSSDLTLQPFLEQLLPFLVTSFSAQGGLIWLRPHGGHGSWFALRHRMEPIQFAPQEAKKHELLVQFAWQQRRPLILAPKSKAAGQPRNPSDYSLAFAPVVHWGEPIALLELVMLSQNAPADIAAQRLFLQALQVASEQIQQGLRSRMNLPAATISQATHAVDSLKEEIRSYEESLRKSIEARLRQFQGWAFGSLQENQAFAKMVHELLDQHGLRVQCPECGNPAILRCLKAGNSKNGVFVFDHYLDDGRTFHGGPTAVPALTLIGKPQRRPNLSERCAS